MDYRDIQKLKAFFSALKDSGFKQDLRQISSFTTVDGQRTPVDKSYCLQLLRKLPQFQGDKFKDDNTIIKYLSDPKNRKFLLDNFTREQQIELTKVLEEKPVSVEMTGGGEASAEQGLPAQTPVGSATGSVVMPGLPSIPSAPFTRSAPRIIHNIPHAPEAPKPKTIETGLDYEGKPYQIEKTPPPVIAGKKTPERPYTTRPSPASANRGFQAPKIPSFFRSAGQDLASQTSIGIRKGLVRTSSGFSNILSGIGRGGGSLLSGIAGGGGRFLGGAGIRSLDSIAALSNQVSRGSFVKGPPKKVWGGILSFLLIFIFISGFAPPIQPGQSTQQPTTKASPTPNQTFPRLNYTLPLKDPTIVPLDIKNDVLSVFPGAKIEYWDDPIVKRSVTEGWNPALVLALWIEETGASQATLIANGGSEILTAGSLSKGHLGCAPKEDQTIDESLDCLFKFGAKYTNDQFTQFMATYSSGPPDNPFFPSTVRVWYSKLVPSGPGAVALLPTLADELGCPTVGKITNPYGYNIPGQPNDIDYAGCDNLASCHSGIDIEYGRSTSVSTVFDGTATTVSEDGVKGKYVTITNSQSGYSATFAHLDSQIVSQGETVKRGQAIGVMGSTGAVTGTHLHYRLEKNGKIVNPFRYLGSSALIETISLTESDDISANDYRGKPLSFYWGVCTKVP